MKTSVIIQARMGSTRLPGKVLKQIEGKTVLEHVITRIKQSNLIDEIIIATSNLSDDDLIQKESERLGINVFRGDEKDVLSRYYLAASEARVDTIIRITSDCPLIDPKIVDEVLSFYLSNDYDIVSNAGKKPSSRTYPRGLDTEIFSYDMLEKAYNNASESHQREHVTPYIYEHTENIYYYRNDIDYSNYRWTLDTEADLKLIESVYQLLYKGEHNFYMEDIVRLFEENKWLNEINDHIQQKEI